MSHPHTLTSLTEREAITDALYRAILGFDHNDVSIFNTAFIRDEESFVFDLDGKIFHGLDSGRKDILEFVGPMDTTHMISNIRVDIPSATSKTASLNCYALAQHCPPGEGGKPDGRKFLAASEYFVDLEKDESDELWKIAKWAMKIIWTQGDASVMAREG